MALSQDLIEPETPRRAGRFSMRPVLMIGGSALALAGIAVAVALDDPGANPSTASDEKALPLLPDRASARELRSADSPAGSAGDAGATRPTITVPATGEEQDNLGTTSSVPPIPGASASSYEATGRAQVYAHALELQKWQLGLHQEAFAATTRVKAFEDWRKAENAEMAQMLGGGGGADESGLREAMAPAMAMLGARGRAAMAGFGGGAAQTGAPASSESPNPNGSDPNLFGQKLDFYRRGGEQLEPGELEATVRQPASPYQLQMGSHIPAVLISGIHSEAPGQVTGQVSENVYDSASGRYLLIPQGSRVVGTYSAMVSQGQTRVQIAWVRLNFPDGASLDLGGMAGADQTGVSGFHDRVNRHFARRFLAALMTTSLTVAYELTAPRNGQVMENAAHRGVGESIVQLGTDMARQEAQLPPTLEIRSGYRFVIAVSKDITFPGPYDDGIQRRTRR